MEACELTILMPCLNEAETITSCIQKAKTFLMQENVQGEILIADNGSTDGSQQLAQSLGARVITVTKRGYGAALKSGIDHAEGRYVIMGDADDSYQFNLLKPFLDRLRTGDDLVMGNRFKGGIQKGAMPFLNRYLGNPVLSFLGRLWFKNNVGDFHCGLRGFHRERMVQLELQGDGMEFASEMVVKATLKQLKVTEVPTPLFPDGRSRRPHLRPWRDGWRHLRLLLLFSPRWLFFYPGLVCFMFGLMLLSGFNLDIPTMLFSSLFIIIGQQAVSFGFFANRVANQRLQLRRDLVALPAWVDHAQLEHGLFIGLVLILCGLGGSVYSSRLSFDIMRVLIPSVTTIIVGCQLVFACFFMRLLSLHEAQS